MSSPENRTFIGGQIKDSGGEEGCCQKKSTSYCCYATFIFGVIFLILGLVVLVGGQSILNNAILKTMALHKDTERLETWLDPPVQPHLTTYGFHVTNPEAVIQGRKPILKEIGPFVYKAVTVKDSVDFGTDNSNLKIDEKEGTITYRPRKFYSIDLEASAGDPDKTFVTVPNIPFFTGMYKYRNSNYLTKTGAVRTILNVGRGTPFINVSFSGLLWGYKDELPCNNLPRPDECGVARGQLDLFDLEDSEEEDDDWGDWRRRKRDTASGSLRQKRHVEDGVDLRMLDHDSITKAKAAFVDCECEWGLFRDRNVTLRKPIMMNSGILDLGMKGMVMQYNNDKVLNWWERGSTCDKVGGRDGGTLPPGIKTEDHLEIFIDLMCRKINLEFEKSVEHKSLPSLRFIPPPNAMGSHQDMDPNTGNPDNACYCLRDQGFSCFKSGVLNMAPCKRAPDMEMGAPIALSFPHFYQADPSFREAVGGLNPNKEEHEFYVDISPEFGFPLAIRPRFQLNAIIQRDPDVPILSKFPDELILPFLWAQDGFSEPSDDMEEAIRYGLAAPKRITMIGGIGLLLTGGAMSLGVLIWWMVTRKII